MFENCFGIFRFSISDKDLLPPKGKMKVYSVVISCLLIILTAVYLPIVDMFTEEKKFLDIMDVVLYLVLSVQYLISAIATSFLNSEINIRIICMFTKLDKMINIDSIESNKGFYTSRAHAAVYLFILILIHSAVNAYMLIRYFTLVNTIGVLLEFVTKLEILIFCIMICMLKKRLHTINGYIMKFIETNDDNNDSVFTVIQNKANTTYNWIGQPSDKNMKIHDLALAYDHAGIICALINDAFNFQLFVTLIITFIYIILSIWYLLYIYLSEGFDIGLALKTVLWFSESMLEVVVMTLAGESLRVAREWTKTSVNKIIMNYNLPKIMKNQAKAFMQLIEVGPLSISFYDMFTIDITLILKIISLATTYLIVVIQISHFV